MSLTIYPLNYRVRKVSSSYKEVELVIENNTIDLGLHDKAECKALANRLKNLIYELTGEEYPAEAKLEKEQ